MNLSPIGSAGHFMSREIDEQPEIWSALSRAPEIDRLAQRIRDRDPRALLTVARGSSEHAAMYGRSFAQTRWGIPTGMLLPSAHTMWPGPGPGRGAVVVAVSQSGASPDLVESVARASASGSMTVALTNDVESELARASDHVLPLLAGVEHAVAATKTYSASAAAIRLLLGAVVGEGSPERLKLAVNLERAFQAARESAERRLPDVLASIDDARDVHIVARGPQLATAREAALKLTETSGLIAQGWSAADILHGPIAAVGERSLVLGLDGGRGDGSVRSVLATAEERGATVIPLGTPGATPGLDELDTPIASIVMFQLLALAVSRSRGLDPDAPSGLSKVTRTR